MVQLQRAKDAMFDKTGIESDEVDFNIGRLNLFEDEEFNAISKKLPEQMKEAVKMMQER
jgi:HSP90 family molecular chaperone